MCLEIIIKRPQPHSADPNIKTISQWLVLQLTYLGKKKTGFYLFPDKLLKWNTFIKKHQNLFKKIKCENETTDMGYGM